MLDVQDLAHRLSRFNRNESIFHASRRDNKCRDQGGMDGMWWRGVALDGLVWDEMRRDEMSWDGMGWNGMGWDGMGWDGMIWGGMG